MLSLGRVSEGNLSRAHLHTSISLFICLHLVHHEFILYIIECALRLFFFASRVSLAPMLTMAGYAPVPPIHESVSKRLDPAFVKLYQDRISKTPYAALPSDLAGIRANFDSLYRDHQRVQPPIGGYGIDNVPGWQVEWQGEKLHFIHGEGPRLTDGDDPVLVPGDIRIKVHTPPEMIDKDRRRRLIWPVHFNFRGGAWAVGDLDTDRHFANHICDGVKIIVIDVEYRRVPEYPFGVGIMDAYSAVRHVLASHEHYMIDPNDFTLGGSSSGATIALILNHLLRDDGYKGLKGVFAGTPLISDVSKLTQPEMSPFPSMSEFQYAPLLDWQKIKLFETFKAASRPELAARLMGKDKMKWFQNLLNAPNFQGLAPTFIATAEIDPRRDEAAAYAERMREAGNKATDKQYAGMPHQFMYFDNKLPPAREYISDAIEHIKACLKPVSRPQQSRQESSGQIDDAMDVDQPGRSGSSLAMRAAANST